MFLKIGLSNILIFCCNFSEKVISDRTLLVFPSFDQVKVRLLNQNFWKFESFLKRFSPVFFFFKIVFVFQCCLKTPNFTFLNLFIPQHNISSNFWNFEYLLNRLSHIFLSENNSCVVTLNKNIQICVPESGHATVKYFIEILNFWMFLKQTLSHIFVS